jgi:hypothetical protein
MSYQDRIREWLKDPEIAAFIRRYHKYTRRLKK